METITTWADIIDVRDVVAEFERLESEEAEGTASAGELWKLEQLSDLLSELKGYGYDEQWRGDWYPITLIRDSYFKTYAQELAKDIGAINSEASWPAYCIDWERAARELQVDYSTVEYDGITYWYR